MNNKIKIERNFLRRVLHFYQSRLWDKFQYEQLTLATKERMNIYLKNLQLEQQQREPINTFWFIDVKVDIRTDENGRPSLEIDIESLDQVEIL